MEHAEHTNSRRCQFWLPRKARFCTAIARPNLAFCGNHKPPGVETRIPCPIDSTHTILQAQLETHSRKCPALMRLQQLERMQYYRKEANAGSDDEIGHCSFQQERCCCRSQNTGTVEGSVEDTTGTYREEIAGQQQRTTNDPDTQTGYLNAKIKRIISNSLSKQDFLKLIQKIESAYNLHCKHENEHAFLHPPACSKWLDAKMDRRIPFQEKHIVQQASLLGNMETFGLLQPPNNDPPCCSRTAIKVEDQVHLNAEPVYVDFGAGRGYLAHMLADCYQVQNVVLVERRSYKFKADRTLRQIAAVSLERIRVDIENLDLKGVKSLQGRHYVALSKHLCGYATDITLRCCCPKSKLGCYREGSGLRTESQNADECVDSLCGPLLDGIAIATCCHHLCQWKPYVNKEFFKCLGFTKREFCVLTWLTSWALSGDKEHICDDDGLTDDTSPQNAQPSFTLSTSSMNIARAVDRMGNADVQDNLSKWAGEPSERVTLGRKCKQLIDVGRLYWLIQNGMDAKLVSYVPPTVSPENKLLLARWASLSDK